MNGSLDHVVHISWSRRTSWGWWHSPPHTGFKIRSLYGPWLRAVPLVHIALPTVLHLYEWEGKKHMFFWNLKPGANTGVGFWVEFTEWSGSFSRTYQKLCKTRPHHSRVLENHDQGKIHVKQDSIKNKSQVKKTDVRQEINHLHWWSSRL